MHDLSMLSVARKLQMDESHDLRPCEIQWRRRLDDLVQARSDGPVFVPLLYNWELYTGDATEEGHFANMCALHG